MGSAATVKPKQYLDDDGNPIAAPKSSKGSSSVADLKVEAAKRKPLLPPPGYILTPYSPSRLQQLRDSVANSAIGHSVEQTMPKVADFLHLHPSETVNSPTYQQDKEQLIAPQYLTPTVMGVAKSVIPDAEAKQFDTPANRERIEGALTAAGGFTTAPSLAMIAAGPLAAPTTAAGVMISLLVSGGFTLDMLHGLYQQSKEYRQAVDSGNMAEAHKIQGEMGVTGVMAFLTAKHALTSHPFTPVVKTPDRARTNVLHRNTAGEVRQAPGQAPSVWLAPHAWESFMGALYPGENAAQTHGINLPANEHLHAFANDPHLAAANPQFGDVQKLLAEAHKNAGEGGVAIAKQRPSIQSNVNVMREELNHTWQRSLANGNVTSHLSTEAFDDLHKDIPKGMQDHLVEQGYDGHSAPEMVTETAAKLMDGRPERFGVTNDEAVDFLDKYFKQVTEQHGPKALEELQHVRGIAADAKAKAIGEHSGAGGGQDHSAVSGVATGGQGGSQEGVPAFNREKIKEDEEDRSLIAMARTAEGKVKLGADPAALGKILGSSLYKSEGPTVITKELVQNAMDAVRQSTGDKNVKVEIFSGAYPPSPTGTVVAHPDHSTSLAIKHPNGDYVTYENPWDDGPVGTPKKWNSAYDAERHLRQLYPQTGKENAVSITDTGKGMTKNELETVFTDLGSSGKRDMEDASGGFGLAKAAPMMMSKKLEVSTVVNEGGKLMRHWFEATPEDLLGSGVDIHSEVLPKDSAPTGTTVTSILPEDARMYGASSFVREANKSLRPPGKIQVFENGKESDFSSEESMGTPIKTAVIPGSNLDLYASDEKQKEPTNKWGSVRAEVHNNGIYQFTQDISVPDGIRGFPKRVAVDVKATVPEGDPNYPFTASRESTHGKHIDKSIQQLVKENVIDPIVTKHNEQIKNMYWNFPTIDGNIPLFDSGTRLTPDELKEITTNPAVMDIANSIFELTASARQKLENASDSDYALYGLGARTKRIGIILSDDVHGLHLTNPEDRNHATIFINPFDKEENDPDAYASLMWHTIQHELVHDKVSGHDESFTTAFKNVSRALGGMNIKALTELRKQYADPNDSARIRPDFDRALQIYRESRSRPESSPDIFGGKESRTEVAGAKGKEGGGRGVSDRGEGIVPPNDVLFNREKDKPVWYLKSERLINDKMKGPQSAEDVHKMLLSGGIKPEEMHWTGLDDFLKSKGDKKVTPQEVKEHLANNNLQIKEVTKGGEQPIEWDSYATANGRVSHTPDGYVIEPQTNGRFTLTTPYGHAFSFDNENLAKSEAKRIRANSREAQTPTKYGTYVLPGGENYREMLLTMPPTQVEVPSWKVIRPDGHVDMTFTTERSARNQARISGAGYTVVQSDPVKVNGGFRSNHWEEPNILAHVRFNDRSSLTYTPEDIKRIEAKIQEAMPNYGPKSWGSGATSLAVHKGLITPEEAAQYSHAKGWNNDTTGAQRKLLHLEELQSDWAQLGRKHGFRGDPDGYGNDVPRGYHFVKNLNRYKHAVSHDLVEDSTGKVVGFGQLRSEALKAAGFNPSSMVPDMPWKKNWHEQAMRRMLQHAVTNGYDALSWTPGADQADRYSLAKQVNSINYTNDGKLIAFGKDGDYKDFGLVPEDKLPDYIGKEAARKLLEQPSAEKRDGGVHPGDRVLSGLDLKVGGEGMHGFYDKIVPDYLNKFGKKYGAKVGTTEIETGKPLSPEVAEKMKKQIQSDPRLGEIPLYAHIESDGYYYIDGDTQAADSGAVSTIQVADKDGNISKDFRNTKTVQHLPITPEMRKSVGEEGVPLFNREQVKTPEFKEWFGDSKIVDKDKQPLVVYHGTTKDFDSFKNERTDPRSGESFPSVSHFTPDARYANKFAGWQPQLGKDARWSEGHTDGGKILPVYIKMEHPFLTDSQGDVEGAHTQGYAKWISDLKEQGYDGIVYSKLGDITKGPSGWGDDSPQYVTFYPSQIKSAIGNNGAFDPNDPNILRNREKPSPAADTLDQKRATAHKDTLNAEAPHGQRMDDIYGEDDWKEMSEDERRDAIDNDYDEADKEEEQEKAADKRRAEQDERVEKNITFMDKHQSAVEVLLKKAGLPYTSKGDSVYSRYITVDLPNDEFATIRISDHEPPVGRGGMKEGGLDYHEEADASIHPGSESLDEVKKLLKKHGIEVLRNREQPSGAEEDNWIKKGAQDFAQQHGRDINTTRYLNPDFRAQEIADAYQAMKHHPNDPKVKATYDALKKDIGEQWDYATKKLGVKFEPWKGKEGTQPYKNSAEMAEDVKNNHHLYFFQGGDMPADHPLAEVDPKTGYTVNDELRAVHDLFGHAMESYQFGPRGEENAWNAHAQMFSPEALPALTSETKGQNSWVNSGSHLRDAKGNLVRPGEPGYIPPAERPFAEQKAGLLPDKFQYRLDAPISFVSPNTFNLSTDRAGIRLGSFTHRMFANLSNGLASELKMRPVTSSAIGIWDGGAENSVIQHFPVGTSPDAVEYHAALMAKVGNQNAWAAFIPDDNGPDNLFTLTVKGSSPEKIVSALKKNGILNSTIEPNADGTHTVWVSGSGDSMANSVSLASNDLGVTEAGEYGGHFKTGGSEESRDAASTEYTRRITELEDAHPEWRNVREAFESRPDYGTLHRLVRETDSPFFEVKHGSTKPKLKEISPSEHGTGPQKGAEAAREKAYPEYWEDRSYFQIKGLKGERLYENLPYQYQALLNSENIYDIVRDPENLKGGIPSHLNDPAGRFTALEKIVKDHGYDGLYTPDGVVEVFTKTPTLPDEKSAQAAKEDAKDSTPASLEENTVKEGDGGKVPEPVAGGATGSAPTTVPIRSVTNVSVPLETAIPMVPVVSTKVLPLSQVMAMAAVLNPQRTVKSVRELMKEAKSRNPTAMIP